MNLKSLVWGMPVALSLAFIVSACESPNPGAGTPSSGDGQQPVESPAVTPSPDLPSPTTPPASP